MQLALDGGYPEPVELRYDVIERALLAMPQVETPTTHHFGPGTYLRQMFAPAGTLVLGKEHRGPCMNIMLTGKCVLIDTDGSTRELTAPQMFVSPPGQKLAYVVADMTWVNIWATDKNDIAELENELFAPSATEFERDMAEIGFTADDVRQISEIPTDLDLDPTVVAFVELKPSQIQGTGCFARVRSPVGAYVGPARLGGKRTRIGRYANHSRFPNVEYRRCGEDLHAYALRPIAPGDEVTVDYRQARGVA